MLFRAWFILQVVVLTAKIQQKCTDTNSSVVFSIHSIQLTEPHQVRSNKNPKFLSLTFPLLPFPRVALMLHPDPQLVHLRKIQQDKVDGIFHTAILICTAISGQTKRGSCYYEGFMESLVPRQMVRGSPR